MSLCIEPTQFVQEEQKKSAEYLYDAMFPDKVELYGEPWDILSRHIGKVEPGGVYNFWTLGRYAMADIICHLLRQTGPADVAATTWSINTDSVKKMIARKRDGLLKSFKMWIDPRISRCSPEPMQLLRENFEVLVAPVHAKIACIGNENWKISVSGSTNFTSSPQPERGVIQVIDHIYDIDLKIILAEFEKGDRLNYREVKQHESNE